MGLEMAMVPCPQMLPQLKRLKMTVARWKKWIREAVTCMQCEHVRRQPSDHYPKDIAPDIQMTIRYICVHQRKIQSFCYNYAMASGPMLYMLSQSIFSTNVVAINVM